MSDTVTTVRLKYDRERMENNVTLGDLIDAEHEKLEGMRNVLAHFMTNETGEYLSTEDAQVALNKLTLGQVKKISEQFREATLNDAVPPTTPEP